MRGGSDKPFASARGTVPLLLTILSEVLYEPLKTWLPTAPQSCRARYWTGILGRGQQDPSPQLYLGSDSIFSPWITPRDGPGISPLPPSPVPEFCLCVWSREGKELVGSPAEARGQPCSTPAHHCPVHTWPRGAALLGGGRKIGFCMQSLSSWASPEAQR